MAIAIGLISMFLAALWSHAYSRWGNTANRDESGYLETSPDYVSSEQEWVIKEMYDYNSRKYMLDDMSDLDRSRREDRYITFTFEDGKTITFRLCTHAFNTVGPRTQSFRPFFLSQSIKRPLAVCLDASGRGLFCCKIFLKFLINKHEPNIIIDVDRSRMRKRYWGIFTTIVVAIILLLAIFLVAFRLLGYEIYTVMSGSMEPKYHVGSLIYVKSVDTNELQKGDVITFVADEDKTVVTHRIEEVLEENNERHFRTKGDANDVADAKLVHYKNVLGKPEFSIPLLGYLAYHIQRPPGLYIAIAVAVALLFVVFYPPVANKRKEKTASKKK